MNMKAYRQLETAQREAAALVEEIKGLETMRRGLAARSDAAKIRFAIYRESPVHDLGCYVTVSFGFVKSMVLPTIREGLKEARSRLAALPDWKKEAPDVVEK